MIAWNEYFARYRALPVWSPEFDEQQDQEYEDKLASTEEGLVADFSAYSPPSSQNDITWFKNALEHEERKFFVAFVLKEPRTVPEILYEPMMRAAAYEKSGTPGSDVSATRKLVPRLKSLVHRLRRWRP
jgi:hypothetical protein